MNSIRDANGDVTTQFDDGRTRIQYGSKSEYVSKEISSDGKSETLFKSGDKVLEYPNGKKMRFFKDGEIRSIVEETNGDIKKPIVIRKKSQYLRRVI